MVEKKNQTRGYLRRTVGEDVLGRYLWELCWHLDDGGGRLCFGPQRCTYLSELV